MCNLKRFIFRSETLRLYTMSEKFHQETSPENPHEFPYRTQAIFLPKLWIILLAKQQHADSLQKVYTKRKSQRGYSESVIQKKKKILITNKRETRLIRSN